MGPSFYLMSFIALFPFSFDKTHVQAPFRTNKLKVVISVIVMLAKLIWVSLFSLSSATMKFVGVCDLVLPHICILIISRESITKHLNTIYALLKRTNQPLKIFWPTVNIFIPFLINISLFLLMAWASAPGFYASTGEFLMDQVGYTVAHVFISTVTCMCSASTLVLNDVYRQLETLRRLHNSDFSDKLFRIARLQWEAYQNAESISVAFAPYLLTYLITYFVWIVKYIFVKDVSNFIASVALTYGYGLFFLCLASQRMQSHCYKMLALIQEMSMEAVSISAKDYNVLCFMMEAATSRNLHAQIPNICKFDLHFFIPLVHTAVTYTIIIIQMD